MIFPSVFVSYASICVCKYLASEFVIAFTLLSPTWVAMMMMMMKTWGWAVEVKSEAWRFDFSIPVIFHEDNSHDPSLPMNGPVSSSPGTTGSKSSPPVQKGSCVVFGNECTDWRNRRRELLFWLHVLTCFFFFLFLFCVTFSFMWKGFGGTKLKHYLQAQESTVMLG